jgi:GNAT superfamily N-acetyltransferase
MKIREMPPSPVKGLRPFATLPRRIYQHDPNWVPPLALHLFGSRLLGVTGLFQSGHPYHRDAETAYFVVEKGREILGCITGSIHHRHNRLHGEKTGFFGFFEAPDDTEVASGLLEAVETWCRERGATAVRGPFNFYINHTFGFLMDAYDRPPAVEMPYNPPYYPRLVEAAGYRKVKDVFALHMPVGTGEDERTRRLAAFAEKVRQKYRISIRKLDIKKLEQDVILSTKLYNSAWSDNWGFVPITEDEARWMARGLRAAIDPGLFLFALMDGVEVGLIGALPDINRALRPRRSIFGNSDPVRLFRLWRDLKKCRDVRLMLLGVRREHRKKGLEALLFLESFQNARKKGLAGCEIGWILEDNHLVLNAAKAFNAVISKTYRVYEKKFE